MPFLQPVNMFDLKPAIDMAFAEDKIPFREVMNMDGGHANGLLKKIWGKTKEGCLPDGNSYFSYSKAHRDRPSPTIFGGGKQVTVAIMHPIQERYLNNDEVIAISSFPTDYNYLNQRPSYLCSMSVPPVMMAQVATRIYRDWLSVINLRNSNQNKKDMNEQEIIAKANEIALAKAREIVEKQFSDVGCMTAKLRMLSIKNDIMDGVRICLELIKQPS